MRGAFVLERGKWGVGSFGWRSSIGRETTTASKGCVIRFIHLSVGGLRSGFAIGLGIRGRRRKRGREDEKAARGWEEFGDGAGEN